MLETGILSYAKLLATKVLKVNRPALKVLSSSSREYQKTLHQKPPLMILISICLSCKAVACI